MRTSAYTVGRVPRSHILPQPSNPHEINTLADGRLCALFMENTASGGSPHAQLETILLVLSPVWLSGCDETHARSAPSRLSSASAPGPTPAAARHRPRDSALSFYNNSDYGVSFRYPRNYLLEEEIAPEDSPTLRTQQELEAEQPGAILVASVLVPDDAYPNSAFTSGHLQLAVNSSVTEETCHSFVDPPNSSWPIAAGTTILPGIALQWRERHSVSDGTAYINRDYAGFSGGTCYELFLEVASTSSPNGDGPSSRADVVKVRRPLEKTVSSLELRAPAENRAP